MRLLGRGFDLVVAGVWYFNLPEAVFSGAPQRLGLYDGHPLQRYADHVVPIDPNLHEAELNLRLVESVFGTIEPAARVPFLQLNDDAVSEAASKFREAIGVSIGDEVVAMHPGSKRPSRRWPGNRFAELATTLLKERPTLKVVFTGAGDGEKALIDAIIARIPEAVRGRAITAFEAGGLLGLTGFYDGCKCLVCNDTGVMHVARARGVPVVAVVGPENDKRWGPYPLGTSPAVVVRQEVPGTPHNKDVCDWNLSLASITSERVARHVAGVLDRTADAEPVVLDGKTFWPVVRDVERLSFNQLHERGLAVPKVAVVVAKHLSLLGLRGSRGQRELPETLQVVTRQRYPLLDRLVVTDDLQAIPDDAADATTIVIEAKAAVGDTACVDATWATVLASTDARLFVIWSSESRSTRTPNHLATLVSAYLRGPGAEVVSAAGPVTEAESIRAWGDDFANRGYLVTRNQLVALLTHPIPLAPAIPADFLDTPAGQVTPANAPALPAAVPVATSDAKAA